MTCVGWERGSPIEGMPYTPATREGAIGDGMEPRPEFGSTQIAGKGSANKNNHNNSSRPHAEKLIGLDLSTNPVLEQMVNPEGAPLEGYLDRPGDAAVTRHRDVFEISSTADDQQFSLVISPNLSQQTMLYMSSALTDPSVTSLYTMGESCVPEPVVVQVGSMGQLPVPIQCSYLDAPDNLDFEAYPIVIEYGRVSASLAVTTVMRFVDGLRSDDTGTTLLDAGGTKLSSDGFGVFDLGAANAIGSALIKVPNANFTYDQSASAPTVSRAQLRLETSPSRSGPWTLASSQTVDSNAQEVFTSISYVTTAGERYVRIRKTTNGTAISNSASSRSLLTVSFEMSIAAYPVPRYTIRPLPSIGGLTQYAQAAAVCGLTVLVTNESDDFHKGGALAAAGYPLELIQAGQPVLFDDLNAYNYAKAGPLEKGAFGIWCPRDLSSTFYRPVDSVRTEENCVVIAGKMASAGAVVKVEVWTIVQSRTTEALFGAQSREMIPELRDQALRILSAQPYLVTENPLHTKLQAALKRIGNGLLKATKATVPHLLKAIPIVGPAIASMASS